MAVEAQTTTAYEALGVDPCAPVGLISASYWNFVKELQVMRGEDPRVDTMLYHAMRAYETLSDPNARAAYDQEIGLKQEPLTKRKFKKARAGIGAVIGKRKYKISADPYEVMGLHPSALPATIPDAYRIMREQYLRLPPGSQRRVDLLRLLEESFTILKDPEKRATYDAAASQKATSAAAGQAAAPEIEPILIEDEHDVEAQVVEEPTAEGAPPDTEAQAPEFPPEPAEEPSAAALEEPPEAIAEAEEPVPEPEPEPAPPPITGLPEPHRARAGRLRVTSKHTEDDDLGPPPSPVTPRRPKQTGPKPDEEAVLLGRLEMRMKELQAFASESNEGEQPGSSH